MFFKKEKKTDTPPSPASDVFPGDISADIPVTEDNSARTSIAQRRTTGMQFEDGFRYQTVRSLLIDRS